MGTTAAALVKAAKASVTEVSVTNAKDLVGQGVVFVDVREPPEWQLAQLAMPCGFHAECSNGARKKTDLLKTNRLR